LTGFNNLYNNIREKVYAGNFISKIRRFGNIYRIYKMNKNLLKNISFDRKYTM